MIDSLSATEVTDSPRSAPSAIAPLIRNCWYVLAGRDECDQDPKMRWVLGNPVVYYRGTSGQPTVLDDRCAHRRFPLSRSKVDGDTIVCGYHGFTYGADGRCVRVPNGHGAKAVRVRSYPTAERGPWVWVWTGSDAEDADQSLIPWPEGASDDGHFVSGYALNPANYSLVHENLLDLTHLEFLHGVPDTGQIENMPRVLSEDEMPQGFGETGTGFIQTYEGPLGISLVPCGDDPNATGTRQLSAISFTPGMHAGIVTFEPGDPSSTRLRRNYIVHCLTPADDGSTHQFWTYWQDVPFAHPDWKGFIDVLFSQDVEALKYVQEYTVSAEQDGTVERSTAHDAAGLKLRRIFHRVAASEGQ